VRACRLGMLDGEGRAARSPRPGHLVMYWLPLACYVAAWLPGAAAAQLKGVLADSDGQGARCRTNQSRAGSLAAANPAK
jgi:hypothetical protein